jgi:MFS family permease
MAAEDTEISDLADTTSYTVFTKRQRLGLTVILGITTLASPLSATIYFPVLPLLCLQFNATIQAINLTVTLYLVFQAISPAIFATVSDTQGRRPVFLITYTIYSIASLGLALNKHSYAVLLVLRAFQSLGASAVVSIAYGVIADVCMPSERGKTLGWVMAATNLGVCIGPVIGGAVASSGRDLPWVFWIFVLFGFSTLLAIGWTFPETARSVVGNGSIPIKGWLRRTWWSILRSVIVKREAEGLRQQVDSHQLGETEKPKNRAWLRKIGNPVACLRLIFFKDSAPVLWMGAIYYAVYYTINTSLALTYRDIYHFNELEIGFSYLPGGVGVVAAGFANGRMMDRNYQVLAKRFGFTVNKVSGDDLFYFPIENARARSSWLLMIAYTFSLIGYGWCLKFHIHESVPLILQCFIGFLVTCLLQTYSTLLVDIFPKRPSTAAAAGNITRCALSAVSVAILQPLVDVMGRGWYFTALAVISGGGSALAVWLIQAKGMKWRTERWRKRGENRSDTGQNIERNELPKSEGDRQNSALTSSG